MADPYRPRVPGPIVDGREVMFPEGETVEGATGLARILQELQPYPVNAPAAVEGLLMSSGMTGGAPGAVMQGGRSLYEAAAASPMARYLMSAAGLGGAGAVVASPSEAGKGSDASSALRDLYSQQSTLQQQMEEARARREGFRPKNRKPSPQQDPQYTEADAEFKRLSSQFEGLTKTIAEEVKRNSPEAILAAETAQKEADAAQRKKSMNTSVKEMFADVAPYTPVASATLAAFLGSKIKGNYVDKFNTKINDLLGRWESAVKSGNKPLAEALETEFKALDKAGPGGTKQALGAGAVVGELGQLGPVVADYSKSIPGSDLYKETTKSMTDPWEVGGRIFSGLAWGMGPAEVAALMAGRKRASPTGFSAETRAMGDGLGPAPGLALPSPGGPPGLGGGGQGGQLALPPPQPPGQALGPPTAGGPTSAQSTGASTLSEFLSNPTLAEKMKAGRQAVPEPATPPIPEAANVNKAPPRGKAWAPEGKGSKIRDKKTGHFDPMPDND